MSQAGPVPYRRDFTVIQDCLFTELMRRFSSGDHDELLELEYPI